MESMSESSAVRRKDYRVRPSSAATSSSSAGEIRKELTANAFRVNAGRLFMNVLIGRLQPRVRQESGYNHQL
jgi:hypothetical protein